MKRVPADFAGRRILGMTFEGEPIFEPANAGASLVLAAAGGGKTTCVTVPAVQCLLASSSPRAILINDVKDGEVASQVGAMCVKHGRKFGAVDEFEVLGCDYPFRLSLNAFGAAVTAFRNESPDLPFIIENITHALIDEPKDDERNFYWRAPASPFRAGCTPCSPTRNCGRMRSRTLPRETTYRWQRRPSRYWS